MYKTEQEKFWAGDFGNEYTTRNTGEKLLASKTALLVRLLSRTHDIGSVLELGCNVGLNLVALRRLLPAAKLSAVEINTEAAAKAREQNPGADIQQGSILDFKAAQQADLVFTFGVLIHIDPPELPAVYDLMFRTSNRYIVIAEYYNPSPVEVVYRGHSGRLFKRDFAGELMERHPSVRLVDYGFVYRRDPVFPYDDTTWFVMEKTSAAIAR
jgi:pseudaminic acid biosynthesis-associated methylase